MQKMPHVTKLLAQNRYNKKQVLYLTQMNEDQYNNFQIDTAKAWLEYYFMNTLPIDDIIKTRLFWQWWMCAWSEADDRFIIAELYKWPISNRVTRYRQLHQYVFDEGSNHQQFLKDDFRHMRSQFEYEVKQQSIFKQQTT